MQEKQRRSNEARTAQTRGALISAARELFIEKGYAETGTPELVAAAGVTRGALYHHFVDKQDVFRATIEAESDAVAREIDDATIKHTGSARDMLKAGSRAYFEAMGKHGRVRLLLVEAPAVLGPTVITDGQMPGASRTLAAGLEAAMDAGEIRRLPVAALTSLLDAAFDRAAMEIAAGASKSDVLETLDALVDGLAA